jgi:hypothetical protein
LFLIFFAGNGNLLILCRRPSRQRLLRTTVPVAVKDEVAVKVAVARTTLASLASKPGAASAKARTNGSEPVEPLRVNATVELGHGAKR